ncbi:hypothetical protein AB0C33_50575 [Nonomuraea sp. NPDC048881]|uniref:hypothetical protein n=1 Tax=Nonomuraea sp. NPDC048881 TaxID=3155030 RepID=UPI0033DFC917
MALSDVALPHAVERPIATLGPAGTDSEREARRHFSQVVLQPSFPHAMDYALANETLALIPAGYVDREGGGMGDTWVDLHFRYEPQLRLAHVWHGKIRPLCIAVNRERATEAGPHVVALHSATWRFAREHLPTHATRFVRSKPEAVQLAGEGTVHACVGSVDVVERFPSLRIVRVFQPTMVWCLYAPADLGERDAVQS